MSNLLKLCVFFVPMQIFPKIWLESLLKSFRFLVWFTYIIKIMLIHMCMFQHRWNIIFVRPIITNIAAPWSATFRNSSHHFFSTLGTSHKSTYWSITMCKEYLPFTTLTSPLDVLCNCTNTSVPPDISFLYKTKSHGG